MSNIKLIKGDCLEKFTLIKDKSIDLVLIDPPYNISKAEWDKWKTVDDYIEFMGKVFLECQRVLKDNGSFYFFHNDFEQMAELQHWIKKNTRFVFNSFITWDKGDFRPLSWKNPSDKSNLRSWFNTCEYCLYYTFQKNTGLKEIDEKYIYKRNPFSKILNNKIKELNMKIKEVAEIGHFYGKVNHGGAVTNWCKGYNIPLKEQWEILRKELNIREEYESLREEYESLREEYESLRYKHNLDKNHNNIFKSLEKNTGKYHPTQKPIDILSRIINTSSNENDIILDCFNGVASTGIACIKTNRNYIGIEKDDNYFDISYDRINTYIKENNLENINVEIIK